MTHQIAVAMVRDRIKSANNIIPNSEEILDARAALEALRDPSDEMLAAAADALRDPRIKTRLLAAITVWRAMIDSALAD